MKGCPRMKLNYHFRAFFVSAVLLLWDKGSYAAVRCREQDMLALRDLCWETPAAT